MKSRGIGYVVASALGGSWALADSLAGAVPSIFDCAKMTCYHDLVHLAGTLGHLRSQCFDEDGKFREGAERIQIHQRNVRKGATCGKAILFDGWRYTAEEYRPVCDCLFQAAIARHCDSIPCHNELFQVAQQSPARLRLICGLDPYQSGRDNVGIAPALRSNTSQCGTEVNGSLQLTPDDYRPVCSCMRSDVEYVRPFTTKALRKTEPDPYYIDVFLHVVVLSKSSLRAKLFKTPTALVGEFQYLVSGLADTGIKFVVKSVSLTVDAVWATGRDNVGMRQSLHRGDNRDLNFYMLDTLNGPDDSFAPIRRNERVYCTFPVDVNLFLGNLPLDGCMISTELKPEPVAMAMRQWIGACWVGDGVCKIEGDAQAVTRSLRHNLALRRYVPVPRGATSPVNYIDAAESLFSHCKKTPCFDELNILLGNSTGGLVRECRSGVLKGMGNVTIDKPRFEEGFQPKCGRVSDRDITFTRYDYSLPCDCLTGDTTPRWTFTEDVILDNLGPIFIDVFIHVVVSSKASSLARRKYINLGAMESEFERVTSFYNDTRIKFRLKFIDLTVNAAWARGNHSGRMRQSLYRGGNRDLNLYYLEASDLDGAIVHGQGASVFCTFPFSAWWATLSGADPEHDGCLISDGAHPGAIATALQHWFGVNVAAPSSCRLNDCGPSSDFSDVYMLGTAVALNRAVPLANSLASRVRLYEALDM